MLIVLEFEQAENAMTGCELKMSGVVLTGFARQQEFVTLSYSRAENVILSTGMKDIVLIRRFLQYFGVVTGSSKPTAVFFIDSHCATDSALNCSFHLQTKNVGVSCQFTH